MELPKLLPLVYDSFQNGDFVLNLLRHVFIINEELNKIDNKYL